VSPPKASAQTEVRKFNVSFFIDQNVVGFDVAMDETHLVDALDGTSKFGNVKSKSIMKRKTSKARFLKYSPR
jgi:hypothetical protein